MKNTIKEEGLNEVKRFIISMYYTIMILGMILGTLTGCVEQQSAVEEKQNQEIVYVENTNNEIINDTITNDEVVNTDAVNDNIANNETTNNESDETIASQIDTTLLERHLYDIQRFGFGGYWLLF